MPFDSGRARGVVGFEKPIGEKVSHLLVATCRKVSEILGQQSILDHGLESLFAPKVFDGIEVGAALRRRRGLLGISDRCKSRIEDDFSPLAFSMRQGSNNIRLLYVFFLPEEVIRFLFR